MNPLVRSLASVGLGVAVMVSAVLLPLAGPTGAAGGGADTVGLVDPSTGRWYLYDEVGNQREAFFYGNAGDVPFMGDWDCDGVDTPGLFRPSDAFAYLRNSNTQGVAESSFFFGNPSDVPLAGDFDGDGCDTLSIYRPSEGRFYIVNRLGENGSSLGEAEFTFDFGNIGDKPVVGDWDGDGDDEIGLHRESTGLFYWRYSLTTGVADDEIVFGDPGDRFVAGDWGVVDGKDTPSVFRPSNTTMFFRDTLTNGVADRQFGGGDSEWVPVAGHFALGPPPTAPPPPFQATYTVTFNSTWRAATHPVSFPSGPHFSGLIGGAHNDQIGFWRTGGLASPGIETMAEQGSKTLLRAEVQAAIAAGNAGSVISGGGIGLSPGSVSDTFSVNVNYPLATIVSMLAPSPDWFVGVSGLTLLEGGAWVENKVVTLWPYDAGTDSGPSYGSPDQDTNPADPIALISTPPVGNGVPVGQFVFTLVSVS